MEFKELFEPIINFLKGLQNKDKENSKDEAKKRLQLVLMQDRASVSPDFFEMMKKEIIEVIKKYIEIDEDALEVQLTRGFEDGVTGPALFANIPIKNIKPVAKKQVSDETKEINEKDENKAEKVDENNQAEVVEEDKQEENIIAENNETSNEQPAEEIEASKEEKDESVAPVEEVKQQEEKKQEIKEEKPKTQNKTTKGKQKSKSKSKK